MKKNIIFYTCLAIAWFVISIASGVMSIIGMQVDAIVAFCPSVICTFLYIDKICDNINKKEK